MQRKPPTASYFENIENGRFAIQHSASTGQWVFYPRIMAPGTGATDLEWVEPSGLGTVYAATVTRRRPPEPDQSLVIVELDEGPRMMTHIRDIDPQDVRIGMRVRARIDDDPRGRIVIFVPAPEA